LKASFVAGFYQDDNDASLQDKAKTHPTVHSMSRGSNLRMGNSHPAGGA
jgi:hypothetical protein